MNKRRHGIEILRMSKAPLAPRICDLRHSILHFSAAQFHSCSESYEGTDEAGG
jgi:hypothetical protein